MKIIHISRERYDHIRSQGYQMKVSPEAMNKYPTGDTEYHLLDGERGRCESCGGEFESAQANDPAELMSLRYMSSPYMNS